MNLKKRLSPQLIRFKADEKSNCVDIKTLEAKFIALKDKKFLTTAENQWYGQVFESKDDRSTYIFDFYRKNYAKEPVTQHNI